MAASGNEWKAPLTGCFSDMETCLWGLFLGPCLYWKNTKAMNKFNKSRTPCLYVCGLGPLGLMLLRGDVRDQYGIYRNFLFECFGFCKSQNLIFSSIKKFQSTIDKCISI